jgi:hypothetical protein
MNRFFARFGNGRTSAEEIVSAAIIAPPLQMIELHAQLIQLFKDNVGIHGIEDCIVAFTYAGQLRLIHRLNKSRLSLPVFEIEQRTTGSSMQDIDSSVGMSEVATGTTTRATGTESVDSMDASNTLASPRGNVAGSVESMDTSNTLPPVMLTNPDNDARSTASMSLDMDPSTRNVMGN